MNRKQLEHALLKRVVVFVATKVILFVGVRYLQKKYPLV